jgi:hypothetical protein
MCPKYGQIVCLSDSVFERFPPYEAKRAQNTQFKGSKYTILYHFDQHFFLSPTLRLGFSKIPFPLSPLKSPPYCELWSSIEKTDANGFPAFGISFAERICRSLKIAFKTRASHTLIRPNFPFQVAQIQGSKDATSSKPLAVAPFSRRSWVFPAAPMVS